MISSVVFLARGMHCHGCEHIIERAARGLPGVRRISADYPTETVSVDFDSGLTSLDEIRASIDNAGYQTQSLNHLARRRGAVTNIAGLIIAVAGLLLIIFFDTEWISQSGIPDISQHMDLGLTFLLGLLTGFHCVGMCGGFVLSYAADDARAGRSSYLSHLLYGAGKTLSYTVIGASFGLLGAFVAFTPLLRGVGGLIAGAFLIMFGLNMLGLFAPLRRFRFELPAPLQNVINKESRGRHHPFVIGLLNGLMIACGPLQAMYVMAAGTGSALEGAKMLFAFRLGTLPVLSTFGALTTFISGALTYRLLRASGVIVVVLGAVMINRGLILTGSGYDLRSVTGAIYRMTNRAPQSISETPSASLSSTQQQEPPLATVAPEALQTALKPQLQIASQTIKMDVTRAGFSPNHFVLIKGVPVKWIIDGKQITTCNNRIVAPSLHLEFDVKMGRQMIEFTPNVAGIIAWSCWMGMLRGEFEVTDAPSSSADRPGTDRTITPLDVKTTSPNETSAPASMPADVYTVTPGDTLRAIAIKLYGDGRRWSDIAAVNPGVDPRHLQPSQMIKLPASAYKKNVKKRGSRF